MKNRLRKFKLEGVESTLPDRGYAWLAMDVSGYCYAYTKKPKPGREFWIENEDDTVCPCFAGKVDPKKYDWKKSLTEIPIVTEIP